MRTAYSLSVGLAGLAALLLYGTSTGGWLSLWAEGFRPGVESWVPVLLLVGLSIVVQRTSYHFVPDVAHSLTGLIDLAAVLALGASRGALVAWTSGFAYLEIRALLRGRRSAASASQPSPRIPVELGYADPWRSHVETPLFNAGLKALAALASGILFQALATAPPSSPALDGRSVLALGVVCLSWPAVDHIGWGVRDYLEGGWEQLQEVFRAAVPAALLVEVLPLPFSLFVALAYAHLSLAAFLLLAAAIVGAALLTQTWADTRRELTKRISDLSTVEQVGRAIAMAELDVDGLCRLLLEHTSRIMDATFFHVGLFDGDSYAIKLWVRDGQEEPRRTFRLAPGEGLVTWLRESRQALLIGDFEKEMETLPARPAYVADRPPRSALFVPLMARESVIGTLSIQSYRSYAYGEDDLRVLSAMANQAAVAMQKAQLYNQERKRARQLETIGQVSRRLVATLELDNLFRQTVELIRENFRYYHVAIYAVDPERGTVVFQASASASGQEVAFAVEWGQGLIGWVAARNEPVVVNDVANDTRYRCIEALDETQSELAVPLHIDDQLVGVLDVQSDQVAAFGSDDLFILETLGDQVAAAIQEARLYEAERQQAWLSTALLQVAEASSRLADMDDVLTTIVRLTPLLAGVDRCAVLLWNADTEIFFPAQVYGLAPELRGIFQQGMYAPGSVPALDVVRYDKSPLLVNTALNPGLVPLEMVQTFDIREMVFLPLMAQGELLGAMLVDYAGRAHPFSQRSIEMLTGIANQAAMVIHSAQLLQAQEEEAYVSMALLQVAEAVSRSSDLDSALTAIVRITPLLIGVEVCTLFLLDEEAAALRPAKQFGLPRDLQPAFWSLSFSLDHPLAATVLAGKPAVVGRDLPATPETVLLQGTGAQFGQGASLLRYRPHVPGAMEGRDESLLSLPLVVRGDVVGMMCVDYIASVRRFGQRWMGILTGIANQAALAVESDRLLQEAAEQERMKRELEVAQRIQSSFLPDRYPDIPGWELAALWRAARQVGGDFYDFVPIRGDSDLLPRDQGSTGVVIADVADKGVPAALFMALSRTLVRTMAISGRSPSQAIAQANNLILADARSDLFVTLFYAILQSRSGEVTYVNAGHMPPLLIRSVDGSAEELRTGGMALGVLPDIEFEEKTVYLEPGDVLILYTDGIAEASNVTGDMFGRWRLIETAQAHRTLPPGQLIQVIETILDAFVGDAPQFDDLTLVIVRRSPLLARAEEAQYPIAPPSARGAGAARVP